MGKELHDWDSSLQKEAMLTALRVHKNRYGDAPYVVHLARVVEVLCRFGFSQDDVMLAAGWLHDAIEDTELTHDHIASSTIGSEVADLVWAVTSEPGRNRKERNPKTYLKIRAAGTRAVALKVADRIANVESCVTRRQMEGTNLFHMYRKEWPGFREALYLPLEEERLERMWGRLGSLFGPGPWSSDYERIDPKTAAN